MILLSLLIFTLYRLATPPVHFVSLWGVTLVISGVGGFFCLFFPYVFPLQVQNLLHKVLHAGGAILLHALGEVTVFVQS